MTNEYRIELLEEAQEMLRQVILIVQSAVQKTEHFTYYEAYLIRNLRNMIDGENNPYDANLERLIEMLQEEEDTIENLD